MLKCLFQAAETFGVMLQRQLLSVIWGNAYWEISLFAIFLWVNMYFIFVHEIQRQEPEVFSQA